MPLKLYKRGEVWWYRGTVAERVRWCGPPVAQNPMKTFRVCSLWLENRE